MDHSTLSFKMCGKHIPANRQPYSIRLSLANTHTHTHTHTHTLTHTHIYTPKTKQLQQKTNSKKQMRYRIDRKVHASRQGFVSRSRCKNVGVLPCTPKCEQKLNVPTFFFCVKNGEAKQAQIVERLVAAYGRGVVSSLAGSSPSYNRPVTGRKKQDTLLP